MSAKEVRFGMGARLRLLAGMNLLAEAVRGTLGPKARTVMLERPFGPPTVINSGVIVAREIEVADPWENMGVQLLREVAAKTSEVAGDGTTTATLLAAAMVGEGMKAIAAGMNAMGIRRGMERAAAAVSARLLELARPCDGRAAMTQVATISANNDAALGAMIAEAMDEVGPEGVVTVEEGKGLDSTLERVEGMAFDRGYLSPYFLTDARSRSLVLENAAVLIHDAKIAGMADLLPFLEHAVETGMALLVIAEDVEGEALAMLVVNAARGTVRACAVKAPGFGDQRKALLEDLAIVTGATVVAAETGHALQSVGVEVLGRAERVEIDHERTTVIGGKGDPDGIARRVTSIRAQLDAATGDHDKDRLRERAARLSGGVAIVSVGGATESEMKERKSRVEDAVHATRAAVAEGTLPGGGVALLRARPAAQELSGGDPDEDAGVRIVLRALEEPLRQLAVNSGAEASVVLDRVMTGTGAFGFNAATGEFGDLLESGVLDPCKVTRTALQNAVSVAALVLTTDCAVAQAGAESGGDVDAA